MQHIITYLAVTLFCTAVASAQKKSDREEMALRGPVQRVSSTEWEQHQQSGMWVDDTIRASALSVFDVKGRIIESRVFGSTQFAPRIPLSDYETLAATFWTRAFDDNNLTHTTTYYQNDTTVSHYLFKRLSEGGDEIEILRYNSDPQYVQSRKTYEYDDRGRIVKVIEAERSDTGVRTTVLWPQYDTVRNTATTIYYTSDRKAQYRETVNIDTVRSRKKTEWRIRYDRSGYDERGVRGYRLVEYFDSFNRRRKEQIYMLNLNDLPSFHYEYDENGRRVVELTRNILSMIQENQKWERSRFVFDTLGNEIAHYREHFRSYPASGNVMPFRIDTVTTTLTYDAYGNWIHREIRRAGADRLPEPLFGVNPPYLVQRRDITYFRE